MVERRLVAAVGRTLLWPDRSGGPWDVPAELKHEPLKIPGNTGAQLAARWFPARSSQGAVVLAHPDRRYAQHWFVREGWVGWLLREGFDVLTFDFAGYGSSEGGSTFLHEDVEAAAYEARARALGRPVHVLGVSLGAFAAANASPRLGFVDALVLESPYPSFHEWYANPAQRLASRAFNAVFRQSARAIDVRRNLPRAGAKRVLVAATSDDRVTPPRLSREVARQAPPGAAYVEVAGVPHLGLLASEPYREAVLRALRGQEKP